MKDIDQMIEQMHCGNRCRRDLEMVETGEPLHIKNRHTPHFAHGHLSHVDGNRWLIESDEDIQGIAPGQFAVIYDRDQHLCYGSGVITL